MIHAGFTNVVMAILIFVIGYRYGHYKNWIDVFTIHDENDERDLD